MTSMIRIYVQDSLYCQIIVVPGSTGAAKNQEDGSVKLLLQEKVTKISLHSCLFVSRVGWVPGLVLVPPLAWRTCSYLVFTLIRSYLSKVVLAPIVEGGTLMIFFLSFLQGKFLMPLWEDQQPNQALWKTMPLLPWMEGSILALLLNTPSTITIQYTIARSGLLTWNQTFL